LDDLLDLVLAGRASEALGSLGRIYEGGGELRQVVRGLMERCRDRLVAAIERQDGAARETLSTVLDSLLHLDGEVRRHAEARFLVEAIWGRLAVEAQVPPVGRDELARTEQPEQAPATPAPVPPPQAAAQRVAAPP